MLRYSRHDDDVLYSKPIYVCKVYGFRSPRCRNVDASAVEDKVPDDMQNEIKGPDTPCS